MKRYRLLFLALAFAVTGVVPVLAQEDITSHPECLHCGMDRQMFAHSRMIVEYEDGSVAATCSLRCVAFDLAANKDKKPKVIKVADYNTKALIDVGKASWVIGGSQRGVMTRRAKWAFAKPENARSFIAQYGGEMATFEQALKAAQEDLR